MPDENIKSKSPNTAVLFSVPARLWDIDQLLG
jgi:hypothetical protein